MKAHTLNRLVRITACSVAVGASALANAPVVWADDVVTYEVVSDSIQVATVEYQNTAGRSLVEGVALPWRTDVTVHAVGDAPPTGSQVRADWRPSAAPTRWVSVRIIYQGKVICQNTLDVGDAACYGITPRIT